MTGQALFSGFNTTRSVLGSIEFVVQDCDDNVADIRGSPFLHNDDIVGVNTSINHRVSFHGD